jgi:hypothetical protein
MFRFAMVAMALIAFGAVLAGDNGVTYVTRYLTVSSGEELMF